MNARELARACHELPPHWQLHVNQFLDDFRAGSPEIRAGMVAEGPVARGPIGALVAAVVESLCQETGTLIPDWTEGLCSPEPFYALPARGPALQQQLRLESPPAFRKRNVFVPENYLSRA